MTKDEKKEIEQLRKELIPMTDRLATIVSNASKIKHESEQAHIKQHGASPDYVQYRMTPKGKERYKEMNRLLDAQKHIELTLEKLLALVPE